MLKPEQLPEVSWDFVYGTNMHHGLTARPPAARPPDGTKQIIMVTDGEPTAHVMPNGEVFFHYPPVSETVEATLREVMRCTREGIRINTFMLGATSSLKAFVERMTQINRGRAFFTTPENLGDYVLVDFIEQPPSRRAAAGRGPRGVTVRRLPAGSRRCDSAAFRSCSRPSRNAPLRERDVVCDNHIHVITHGVCTPT